MINFCNLNLQMSHFGDKLVFTLFYFKQFSSVVVQTLEKVCSLERQNEKSHVHESNFQVYINK